MKYTTSDFFLYYIEVSGTDPVLKTFEHSPNIEFLQSISEEKSKFRYAEDKWSIKQVVGHMTDHERIMTYRALRTSRKDTTPLAGYEQNDYVTHANFDHLPFELLVEDYTNTRKAALSFMRGLSHEQWQLQNNVWKFRLSVEEMMRAVIGHEFHHIRILKERYF